MLHYLIGTIYLVVAIGSGLWTMYVVVFTDVINDQQSRWDISFIKDKRFYIPCSVLLVTFISAYIPDIIHYLYAIEYQPVPVRYLTL